MAVPAFAHLWAMSGPWRLGGRVTSSLAESGIDELGRCSTHRLAQSVRARVQPCSDGSRDPDLDADECIWSDGVVGVARSSRTSRWHRDLTGVARSHLRTTACRYGEW